MRQQDADLARRVYTIELTDQPGRKGRRCRETRTSASTAHAALVINSLVIPRGSVGAQTASTETSLAGLGKATRP
jgi:hypothetical protein